MAIPQLARIVTRAAHYSQSRRRSIWSARAASQEGKASLWQQVPKKVVDVAPRMQIAQPASPLLLDPELGPMLSAAAPQTGRRATVGAAEAPGRACQRRHSS